MRQCQCLLTKGISPHTITSRAIKEGTIDTLYITDGAITKDKLEELLFAFVEKTTRTLRSKKQYAKTIAVIFKNNKFETYSAQEKLERPSNNITEIYKLAISIFRKNYKNDPIRLLGFRLADLTEQNDYQMSLFDQDEVKTSSDTVQATIDNINKKFGKSIVAPASIKLISKKSKEK